MAWWTTQFIFQGDTLISEGLDPVFLSDLEWVVQDSDNAEPDSLFILHPSSLSYTRVIVSGYALYGELRGYYALGVAHWRLDRATGRAFLSETSQRNSEPVSSLTPAQRAILRECLLRFNPEAWETSNVSFRRQLEA